MPAETSTAATPNTGFDPDRGHPFVRSSLAGPQADRAEAVKRLEDQVKGRCRTSLQTTEDGGAGVNPRGSSRTDPSQEGPSRNFTNQAGHRTRFLCR
jgi:hypothetical protein